MSSYRPSSWDRIRGRDLIAGHRGLISMPGRARSAVAPSRASRRIRSLAMIRTWSFSTAGEPSRIDRVGCCMFVKKHRSHSHGGVCLTSAIAIL